MVATNATVIATVIVAIAVIAAASWLRFSANVEISKKGVLDLFERYSRHVKPGGGSPWLIAAIFALMILAFILSEILFLTIPAWICVVATAPLMVAYSVS